MSVEKRKRKKARRVYDQQLSGWLGAMGSNRTMVRYIQLNIPVSDLDLIGLVSEIPGSEKWPVRQLFQRDIDWARVENEIMPYFTQKYRVKFFNPITVAALPIDVGGEVKKGFEEKLAEPSEQFAKAVAVDGCYRLSFDDDDDPFGELAWNTSKVRLIAIDGQHRLSALKRLKKLWDRDPSDSALDEVGFNHWKIPIVLVTVGHSEGGQSVDRVLEKTREIFVTINKQARQPTRSRTILLNDYSVTAIACQETLDGCREQEIPLAFFNWRDHRDEDHPDLYAHLMGVDELEDILGAYLIGLDDDSSDRAAVPFSNEQRDALYWGDLPSPPDDSDVPALTGMIRRQFKETVFPAIVHVLRNCTPIAGYVEFLQNQDRSGEDDIHAHAWSQIVYGTDYSHELIGNKVQKRKQEILKQALEERRNMGWIFSRAVGSRAIFAAFSLFYEAYCAEVEIISWAEGAKIFTEEYNRLFDKGVITNDKLTRNIVLDGNDGIINYRIKDVVEAYGAAIAYAVLGSYGKSDVHDLSELEYSLKKKLTAEFRKLVRPEVKDELHGKPNEEINKAVNDRAQRKSDQQMKKIERLISRFKVGS